MSVDDCRNQVMNCTEADEVRVEVNQRHLIDKMLARYASEFVIFRELMQNADDAKSTTVEIIFNIEKSGKLNTITGINDVRHTKYARIQFRNNGFAFRPEDWNRLKKIAEGNPDEKKVLNLPETLARIGAFGVGFYSLFSVCEQPFVSSGGQGMAFYWHGDQLLAKQATTSVKDEWTTFLMDVREPTELPDLDRFGRFLATSLGFTVNLREVSVYFDDHSHCIIHLKKQMGSPRPMAIRSDINKNSPKNMFKLESVEVRDVQFSVHRIIPSDVSLSKSLFSSYPKENASIHLCVASGNLKVQVQKEFVAEMERMTKKKPPSQTTMQLIFTRNDDNFEFKNNMSKIFQDLLPFPEQGRVFIGFRTHQTTGCSVHIAARVIPTVERESIDFADKTLSAYNSEMLCLAGVLCRLLYEDEMNQVANSYLKMKLTDSVRELLEKRAAHALAHFNFHPSTPDPQAGKIIETQFFNCDDSSWFPITSTSCVDTISKIRLPNPEVMTFVKSVPVVPKIVIDQCEAFFKKAKDKKLIEEISINDVFKELKSRILSQEEIVDLIQWWISYCSKQSVPKDQFDQFMKLAIIRVGKSDLSLRNIRHFLNPCKIQPDADLPPNLLPYCISKKFNKDDFKCFNWTELSPVEWTKYIVEKPELENDAKYVDKFWEVLSRNINSISNADQIIIYKLLCKKKCMPTNLGLKRPKYTYFPNVTLFSDLPNVNMKYFNKIPEKFFIKLGVRKCAELELVFDRLASSGNFDHTQLVKYFTQNEENLKKREIEKLKSTAIWLREQQVENVNVIKHGKSGAGNNIPRLEGQRYLAKDLYVPYVQNRDLELPIIQWKGRWNNYMNEEKFLIKLGIQLHPSLQTILKLATPVTNITIRNKALDYFIKNFDIYRKEYDANLVQEKFLPCIDDTYAKPSECFSNCECMVMRFNALRKDLCNRAEELGVQQHPQSKQLLQRLSQEPPKSIYEAEKIFNYLASRRGDLDHWDWKTLANLSFIPVQNKSLSSKITYATPKNCFLKSSDERFVKLFPHVDFGEKANKFLENCGVRLNPSSTTLAELLITSSEEFYDDVDKYITILNIIACDLNSIENNKSLLNKMGQSPILLGVKKPEQFHLARAKDIFIYDNPYYAKIFNPLVCTFNDNLKKLYITLGCRSLDESVKEMPQLKGNVTTSQASDEVQQRILERLPIYYGDITNDNIRNDEEWIKKLKVKEIHEINISYTLDAIVKIEPARACVYSESNNSLTLCVTRSKIDYFDISKALLNYIHKHFRRENISHMYNILTQSQEFLKRLCPSNYVLKVNKDKIHGSLSKKKWSAPVSFRTLEALQNELLNLINSCQSNLEGTIDNQAVTNTLTDCKTYCDVIPELSLTYVGIKNEIKLYIAKNLDSSIILSKSMENTLMCFINILINLADIFGLTRDKIHIFYDNDSSSIAFNRQNVLFFSLKYYIESHYSENSTLSGNAMISWFMTFCHELAHNAIKQHSSKHE
ncbi:12498_t:CDS:10, partial [Dentiscutata erythropus]